jgi:hypothetical protein
VSARSAHPRPFTLRGLLLVGPRGEPPVAVEGLTFAADGIAVTRTRGGATRILAWDDVTAHAVEPWPGGTVPARWLTESTDQSSDEVTGSSDDGLPYVAAGVLLSVQTPAGTYRFLRPGLDPTPVAHRFDGFVVHHHGPQAASSVTRVAGRSHLMAPPGVRGPVWRWLRPVVIVGAAVLAIALISLVLLQSAGVIHLPILGGPGGPGGAGMVTPNSGGV